MACPTCSATMECIGSNERADNFMVCPRCGTVKIDAFGQHGDKVYVPNLVERCRHFEQACVGKSRSGTDSAWRTLGIAESINPPENRK